MKRATLSLMGVKVTEDCFLDMKNVRKFYNLAKGGTLVSRSIAVEDPENGASYFVDGHHRSYGQLLSGIRQAEFDILENDQDVAACTKGRAKDHNTLNELLESCRKGHASGRDELGIQYLPDYSTIHRMPKEWENTPTANP